MGSKNKVLTLMGQELENSEVSSLQNQVGELTEEIERLKQTSGVQKIALDSIESDPDQPRKIFSALAIEKLAKSLAEHGQETPIILFPQSNGLYPLFDGERRWRGARSIGWTHLNAVIKPRENVKPIEIFKGQLVTAIQSEQLHPLDLASAILKIAVEEGLEGDQIPRMLDTLLKRASRNSQLDEICDLVGKPTDRIEAWVEESTFFNSPEEATILKIILDLQLHPKSVSRNILPMLALPPELKIAIRERDLEASKALTIAKLTPEKLNLSPEAALALREETISATVDENLSLSAVKAKCTSVLPINTTTDNKKPQKFVRTIGQLDIQSLSIDDLGEMEKLLELKLAEIRERSQNVAQNSN